MLPVLGPGSAFWCNLFPKDQPFIFFFFKERMCSSEFHLLRSGYALLFFVSCASQPFTTLVELLWVHPGEMWSYKWRTLFQRWLDQSRGLWDWHLSWWGPTYPLKESKVALALSGPHQLRVQTELTMLITHPGLFLWQAFPILYLYSD